MNKINFKIILTIIVVLVFVIIIFYNSFGWTYVKYNGELYVAVNLPMDEEYASSVVGEKIGNIKNKSIIFLKPFMNNTSNGFPKGAEIYKSKNVNNIVIKYNNKLLEVVNTKNEGWGNGFKIKIDNGTGNELIIKIKGSKETF